jgi:hypothetical protein
MAGAVEAGVAGTVVSDRMRRVAIEFALSDAVIEPTTTRGSLVAS